MIAAPRDASWYVNPSTSGASHVPRYHALAENGDGPACNPEGVLLDLDGAQDADDVGEEMRCRRPACRAAFARSGGAAGLDDRASPRYPRPS